MLTSFFATQLSIMCVCVYIYCQFLVFVEVDINVPHLMIGWML